MGLGAKEVKIKVLCPKKNFLIGEKFNIEV